MSDDPYEKLRSAIIEHADEVFDDGDQMLLGDFIVVAAWTPQSTDGDTQYTVQYHSPKVPNHVAHGLLDVGKEIVSVGAWQRMSGDED